MLLYQRHYALVQRLDRRDRLDISALASRDCRLAPASFRHVALSGGGRLDRRMDDSVLRGLLELEADGFILDGTQATRRMDPASAWPSSAKPPRWPPPQGIRFRSPTGTPHQAPHRPRIRDDLLAVPRPAGRARH